MTSLPAVGAERSSNASTVCLLTLGLLLLTFATYLDTLTFGFVNIDDPQYLTANERVQAGLSVQNLKWAFTTGYFSNWHPLVWLSYMLDCQLFGLNASAFHAVNLALHLANTGLLFLLLTRATGERVASWVVAALFAVHPLHCESVTWIAERKDVLSTFLGLLALLAYGYYVSRRTAWRWLIVTMLLACGLMTKPMLVTWPFVFLLLDFWPLNRVPLDRPLGAMRSLLVEKAPWFVMAAAASFISLAVQSQMSSDSLPVHLRLGNAITAYVGYLEKTLIPRNLAVFYPHPGFNLTLLDVVPSALALIAVTGVAILTLRTRPYVAVGWFWYLGTLVPVIGLVQVGYQGMADRYTYIPSIGLFLLLVWVAKDLVGSSRKASLALSVVACLVVLPMLAWTTTRQNSYWRDSLSLWEHAVQVTRNNFLAHNNLGATLGEQGDLSRAQFHVLVALRMKPDYPEALYNWGWLLYRTGRTDEAVVFIRRAVQGNWKNASFHDTLAHALRLQGKPEEALFHYSVALQVDPDHRAARFGRASYYLAQDQPEKAVRDYEKLLELDPEDVSALVNLAAARAVQKRFKEADLALQRAIRLDARSVSAHQNRGRLFEDMGQLARAAASYREALRLSPESTALKEALKRVEKRQPADRLTN